MTHVCVMLCHITCTEAMPSHAMRCMTCARGGGLDLAWAGPPRLPAGRATATGLRFLG